MKRNAKLFRSRQKVPPNRSARRISNALALANLESILPPQDFEHSAHSPQLFQPAFLVSISGASAAMRYFSRIAPDADSFLVCAQASPNAGEKARLETRGFTSCFCLHNFVLKARFEKMGFVTHLFLAFREITIKTVKGMNRKAETPERGCEKPRLMLPDFMKATHNSCQSSSIKSRAFVPSALATLKSA
jgi:hypothetical protein